MTGWLGVAIVAFAVLALLAHRRRWTRTIFHFLNGTEMPIWFSLVLAALAAGGTYVLAPIINQDLEYQKNRSTHVLNTVQQLNKLNIDIAIQTRIFANSLFYRRADIPANRELLLNKITEFQWHLIDVDTVLKRNNGNELCAIKLDRDLDSLRRITKAAENPIDQEVVIYATAVIAKRAKECSTTLYTAANL